MDRTMPGEEESLGASVAYQGLDELSWERPNSIIDRDRPKVALFSLVHFFVVWNGDRTSILMPKITCLFLLAKLSR